MAARPLKQPKEITFTNIEFDRKAIGITFKKDQQIVTKYLAQMDEQQKCDFLQHFEASDEQILKIEGQEFKFLKSMIVKSSKENKII